ncbi:MAG: hypothetical protein V3U80_03005 [Flavobacteriaceae bacterium]
MKNIKYILITAFTMLLVFSSCKKDDPEQGEDNSFSVTIDGEDVDNSTFSYTEVGSPGKMAFRVKNNTSNEIRLKLEVVELIGSGSGIQLCFNNCSADITQGYEDFKVLASGEQSTTIQTKLTNGSDGSSDVTAKLSITLVDNDGVEIGLSKIVDFTYKYTAP